MIYGSFPVPARAADIHCPFHEVPKREAYERIEKHDIGRGGAGGGTQFIHGRSRVTIDPRIRSIRDGARRVFTNQSDIACTKREAP